MSGGNRSAANTTKRQYARGSQRLSACACRNGRREAVTRGELEALALSDLPPQALKTQMLIYAGMTITEAFDKLGVDRSMRYKVRGLLSAFHHKTAGRIG